LFPLFSNFVTTQVVKKQKNADNKKSCIFAPWEKDNHIIDGIRMTKKTGSTVAGRTIITEAESRLPTPVFAFHLESRLSKRKILFPVVNLDLPFADSDVAFFHRNVPVVDKHIPVHDGKYLHFGTRICYY
jgi:hypothetical protein